MKLNEEEVKRYTEIINKYSNEVANDWTAKGFLTLPERYEDETDEEYEESCIDSRYESHIDFANVVKDKLVADGVINKDDDKLNDLLYELTKERLLKL